MCGVELCGHDLQAAPGARHQEVKEAEDDEEPDGLVQEPEEKRHHARAQEQHA